MKTDGARSPGYQTHIAAGGSDPKHPGIWLSSADHIAFEDISITTCLPAVVGTDSNGNPANGQAQDNVFDNVGLWASTSVGCGPGMLIGSSSSRNFIRHSQIRGATSEHALAASISRRSNMVTFTAMANLPSSWMTGMVVGVVGVADPSFDGGDFTITVSGARTFTYPQTGPNATSSGGTAAADGNQAIVVNPHGAQGNSLYADDLSLYDGAIKVYAGTSGTTLDVEKVVEEHGSGPAVWIASCDPSMNVTAWDIRNAEGSPSEQIAEVRSDCARNLQGPANRMSIQNASVKAPATQVGSAGPATKTASPPLSDRQGNSKGRRGGQMRAFAVQVGAFRDPAKANHLKAQIEASYGPVVILPPGQGNNTLYRVWVGHESSEGAARELGEKLISAKLAVGTFIVRVN
jgi:cell division septation protein DedD